MQQTVIMVRPVLRRLNRRTDALFNSPEGDVGMKSVGIRSFSLKATLRRLSNLMYVLRSFRILLN